MAWQLQKMAARMREVMAASKRNHLKQQRRKAIIGGVSTVNRK